MSTEAPRHLARIVVLQSLYASEHGDQTVDEAFESIAEQEGLKEKYRKFAYDLLIEVSKRTTWADSQIEELADNWELERIAAIDKMIMRMGMVELNVFIDTPVKVVINEAIELAKEYSTNASSKFINGILDNFVKRNEEKTN
ncbi:MAG: transcription antitermination factor NusB [Calditrichaeota bacterium]|nr:MAG: transcription antitermination factor NusB [Calditrichota bacterium]